MRYRIPEVGSIILCLCGPLGYQASAQSGDAEQALATCRGTLSDVDRAHRACMDCVSAPGIRSSRRNTCTTRLRWLEERRDPDGGFTALSRLEEIRRDYALRPVDASRREVLAILQEEASDVVHTEARIWLARQAVQQGQTAETVDALLRTDLDRMADLPPALAVQVAAVHAEAVAMGEGAEVSALPEDLEKKVQKRRIRQWLVWSSGGVMLGFAGLSTPLVGLGLRQRRLPQPLGLIPLLIGLIGSWIIVELYEPGTGRLLLWLSPMLIALHAWSGSALLGLRGRRPAWVFAFRALIALATVSAAYLVLWLIDGLDVLGWP